MAEEVVNNPIADAVQPDGSVFINNTSYSGADIKIVVSIYDQGKFNEHQIAQLQQELDVAQTLLDTANGNFAQANSRIVGMNLGTSEHQNLNKLLTSYQRQVKEQQLVIESIQDRIKRFSENKSSVSTKVLAEAQTLSISTHRQKTAVRSMGSVAPKGYTRGSRAVAGSIIFTVFDEDVLFQFLEAHPSDFDANSYSAAILDQLPPVDIIVTFANEYGSASRMTIYGVEFVDEGRVLSIEDILTESTVSWEARDIDPMRSVYKRFNRTSLINGEVGSIQPTRASDLILEDNFQDYKDAVDPFGRQKKRFNPFI